MYSVLECEVPTLHHHHTNSVLSVLEHLRIVLCLDPCVTKSEDPTNFFCPEGMCPILPLLLFVLRQLLVLQVGDGRIITEG